MRSYQQYCGLAKALDIVGERWTLLIVRNLLLGPLRYSELLRSLPGITTNLLAKRLKEMTKHGLLEKTRSSSVDSAGAYRLTPLGRELEIAIHALGRWGGRWLVNGPQGDVRNIEWFWVSLKRRYIGGLTLTAEIVANDVPYTFVLEEKSVAIHRGSATFPELSLRGSADALMRLLHRADATAFDREGIDVHGRTDAIPAFLHAFSGRPSLPQTN